MKIFWKLLLNTILGGAFLFLLNLVGGLFHFQIALNFISAAVVGLLGIPGVGLLIVLKLLFQV